MNLTKKKNLVILTGAGISAESGVPTFRDSADGLWHNYKVEDVATATAFRNNPALVLDFYNARRQNMMSVMPNEAHKGLVDLETYFNVQIITQNIDQLHELAGSTNILHLHGEINKMRTVGNSEELYPITKDIKLGDLGPDGTQWRYSVVMFEEPVPNMIKAIDIAQEADIFVVIGTSLNVYPAAGLLHDVAPDVPKYIIDTKTPSVSNDILNLTAIEAPASVGVQRLKEILLNAEN